MTSPGADDSLFSFKAKTVAVGSILVALGSLAALSIIGSVKDVDVLSTVALALAILAFVVQLIVYIVQAASASQQLADARTLHGEMMSVLSELQTRSAGTQKSLDLLQDQLISELRIKAANSEEGAQVSSRVTQPPRSLTSEGSPTGVAAVQQPPATTPEQSSPVSAPAVATTTIEFPEALPRSIASAIQRELSTWPDSSEMPEILHTLNSLDDLFVGRLRSLCMDSYNFTKPRVNMGPGVRLTPQVEELVMGGFAEKVPGWKLAVPTAKGRKYGRIFTAEGEPPPGTPAELLQLRARHTPPPRDPMEFRDPT